MINLDSIKMKTTKNTIKNGHIYIPDHPFRILIIGGSGSGKTNALPNLIKEQDDINKIYLYAKDLSKPKYELLIKKREHAGTKRFNDPNAFIQCSNTMDDVYKNIDDYNPNRQRKILIVFDDMIMTLCQIKNFKP